MGIIATVLVQSSSTRRGKQSLGTGVEDHACKLWELRMYAEPQGDPPTL